MRTDDIVILGRPRKYFFAVTPPSLKRCGRVPYPPLIPSLKRWGAHGLIWPAVFWAEITARPIFGFKWAKFKNFFFSAVGPQYGPIMPNHKIFLRPTI